MKILLINDYSTPTGGAELLMLGLRDKLRQRGHDARSFSSAAQPLKMNPEADYTCFGTTSSLAAFSLFYGKSTPSTSDIKPKQTRIFPRK